LQLQPLNTLFTGQILIELEETPSSNDYALSLLQNSSPGEGTAILAYKQTKGRGQRENTWKSEAWKNLTISYIFYPRFLPAVRQFDLNLCVSLAVRDCLRHYAERDLSIKWPNDIYIGNKKAAGILIENGISGVNLSYSVVGIGINLNQTDFEGLNAVSLKSLLGQEIPVKECFIILSQSLEARYLQLRSGQISSLRKEYIQNLFRLNTMCDYVYRDFPIRASITGITDTGKLILYGNDGQQLEADLKELRFIL
jgi:BirA family transcriptional regulator, biotin operon repressor / biotin---[acetyl-CoA-carboxylase] ligase